MSPRGPTRRLVLAAGTAGVVATALFPVGVQASPRPAQVAAAANATDDSRLEVVRFSVEVIPGGRSLRPTRAPRRPGVDAGPVDATAIADALLAEALAGAERGARQVANVAVAYASCERCRTIAVAFQVAFVVRPVPGLAVANLSVALNEGCVDCDTLALAHQLVFVVDVPRRELAELVGPTLADAERRVRELAGSDRPTTEVQAGLVAVAAELEQRLVSLLGPRIGDGADPTDEPSLAAPTP